MPDGSDEPSVDRNTQLAVADFQRLPVALLLTINGFLVAIALAALVGIWLSKA